MSQEIARQEEVMQMRNDANVLLFKAEEIAQISSADQEMQATEFLSQAKKRFRLVDERRKEYVKPLKDVIDKINSDFKTILQPLEQVEAIVKKGMTAYRNSEEMKRREEARREAERKAVEAVQAIKQEGLGEERMAVAIEASKTLREITAEAPKTVVSTSGSASFRKETKFEIVSKYEIPMEIQKEVLEVAFEKGLFDQVVRQHVKAGEREIKGVRIWEENVPVIR